MMKRKPIYYVHQYNAHTSHIFDVRPLQNSHHGDRGKWPLGQGAIMGRLGCNMTPVYFRECIFLQNAFCSIKIKSNQNNYINTCTFNWYQIETKAKYVRYKSSFVFFDKKMFNTIHWLVTNWWWLRSYFGSWDMFYCSCCYREITIREVKIHVKLNVWTVQ